MLHDVNETRLVIKLCNDERADQYVWDAIYDKAVAVTADFDTQPSMPKRAGRQQNRANPVVQTVSDYYRVTMYNVFLDHLVQEKENRILGNEHLLPFKRLADLRANLLPTIYAAFAPDLPQTL